LEEALETSSGRERIEKLIRFAPGEGIVDTESGTPDSDRPAPRGANHMNHHKDGRDPAGRKGNGLRGGKGEERAYNTSFEKHV